MKRSNKVRRTSTLRRTIITLQAKIQQLEQEVERDPLTGLLNRRGLERALKAELSRVTRTGDSLTVVFVDIDHFKKVNDVHGHPVGDEVLRKMGQVLQSGSRASDIVARIGGEEFVIAFQGGSAEANFAHINRIRETVRQQIIVPTATAELRITASFGMTERKACDIGLESLFKRADSALYHAKNGGRDRVTHSDHILH